MNSIYLAYTPYHILISCGLAKLDHNSQKKYLVLISDFAGVNIFYRALTKWEGNPFQDIKIIGNRYMLMENDKLGKIVNDIKSIKKLNRFVEEELLVGFNAYIFNDSSVEGQYLSFKNFNKKGSNIYVEDGFAAYNPSLYPKLPFIYNFLNKIIYGTWYESIRYFGTSKYIDEVMVFYPELINPILKSKNLIEISRDTLILLNNTFLPELMKSFCVEKKNLKVDCIILLPHSGLFDGKSTEFFRFYVQIYKNIIDYIVESFQLVGVKYHPSETKVDYLNIEKSQYITIIEKSLPIEIVFLLALEYPPKLIVGDISTALFTARTIYGKSDMPVLLSLIKIRNVSKNAFGIEQIFKKIGILMPESLDELKKELHNII